MFLEIFRSNQGGFGSNGRVFRSNGEVIGSNQGLIELIFHFYGKYTVGNPVFIAKYRGGAPQITSVFPKERIKCLFCDENESNFLQNSRLCESFSEKPSGIGSLLKYVFVLSDIRLNPGRFVFRSNQGEFGSNGAVFRSNQKANGSNQGLIELIFHFYGRYTVENPVFIAKYRGGAPQITSVFPKERIKCLFYYKKGASFIQNSRSRRVFFRKTQ
ncbi:hypothetical protein [Bacillus sp. MUM 13]|uniref:hypothetical protein n=1 Tax=Bacillus sp. MUM 13 TaxID=1678001 RepID=UPI0008F5B648|nr:hypothetical protein [Bacillus sp. MUM 13]OIK14288.1 hypothetical protein BIV59_03265 [Bacillus sp. MUM 13]